MWKGRERKLSALAPMWMVLFAEMRKVMEEMVAVWLVEGGGGCWCLKKKLGSALDILN